MTDLLILGLPRSGTTWVTRTLSAPDKAHLFIEPDNEKTSLLSLVKKRSELRFPVLDVRSSAPAYHSLWRSVLEGGPAGSLLAKRGKFQAPLHLIQGVIEKHIQKKEAQFQVTDLTESSFVQTREKGQKSPGLADGPSRIIKSVHAVGAAAWLDAHFPLKILWIRRHPLDILASWRRMGLADRLRPSVTHYFPELDHLKGGELSHEDLLSVKVLASLLKLQELQINSHPEWVVQDFEYLTQDPLNRFKEMFANLGMDWDPACEEFIQSSQKPGTGFATNRIAKDQTNKWVGELSPEIVDLAQAAFDLLEIDPHWDKSG